MNTTELARYEADRQAAREVKRQENERAAKVTGFVLFVVIPIIVSALCGAGCM